MFCPGGRNGMGCFVRGGKNGMGCYVRGDKNYMGCFVLGGKLMRNVLSRVLKNGMGCFVPGCFVLHSGRSNLVIYHLFTSKFHKWIFTPKSCQIRMCVLFKMACTFLLALVDTLTKPLITRFLPTSIYHSVPSTTI